MRIPAALLAAAAAAADPAPRPHILTFIADDYGWANVGYHRRPGDGGDPREVVTPNIDSLMRAGIELDRHYVYQLCSPTRSSFQSGRLPVHVNVVNVEPTVQNPADPVGGYAGIPVNMTGVAQKMQLAGYRTHMTGKWDVGMATLRHAPQGRGYDTFFGYFHHANDYWTERLGLRSTGAVDVCKNAFADLWDTDRAAKGMNGTGAYEEALFLNRTLSVIMQHNLSVPLFLVHAFHLVHTPLQVPQSYQDQFAFINCSQRMLVAAMAKYMDDSVGSIVAAVRARPGMWERMLVVFFADNGGAIYTQAGGNNWPLKGGKFSDWEGGVRVNAFVSGGFVPPSRRGSRSEQLVHVADWYTTFCALAGVPAPDPAAAPAGLAPVDGLDQWPALSGAEAAGPRREVHLSSQALILGRLKILVGKIHYAGWEGPTFPNTTCHAPELQPWRCQPLYPSFSPTPAGVWEMDCGAGCLYDVFADPTEQLDIAAQRPDDLARLAARLEELNRFNYNPDRGTETTAACAAAERYGGFYGPFVGV